MINQKKMLLIKRLLKVAQWYAVEVPIKNRDADVTL